MGNYANIDELQDNAIEEIAEIIGESDGTIYADIAHRPDGNRFNNLDTTDDGYFLIVDGWGSAAAIGRALLERYPFIADEPRCDLAGVDDDTAFGAVLDLLMEWKWGFADEYAQCGSCGAPMRYGDGECILEDGEITCFDCIDDEYYIEEYLPYTTEIRDEVASQGASMPRVNMKLGDGELRAAGYELYEREQRLGMYDGWDDDPISTVEGAADGYTYIFTFSSASAPYNPFGSEYEIWRRAI